MTQSSAFISYHHHDSIIGITLANQLSFLASHGQGKPALKCFLDAKAIRPGEVWQPIIDENLRDSDWLIVIFTGKQSLYCGYEIGTFSQLNGEAIKQPPASKWIIGLHDVAEQELPALLTVSQTTPVPIVDVVVEPDKVTVSAQEVDYWYASPLGKFLTLFCGYHDLYTPDHETERPADYSNNIALAAKCIACAFGMAGGSDVKSTTPTQISFELTLKGVGEGKPDAIPADARVVGTSLFFDVLELALPVTWEEAPNTTWGNLGELILARGGFGGVPWMRKVEIDVLRAIKNQIVSPDDVMFVGKGRKVYRPILVRHELLVSGDRKFYLLFVETLDRRFAGEARTSILLTSLILASRWRFTYFEKWTETVSQKFSSDMPLERFADSCRQLFYNIEWIETESSELGTYDEAAQKEALGAEHRARVESFFKEWDLAKAGLNAAFLEGVSTKVTEANREALRSAIIQFLSSARSQNADYLELVMHAYSDAVLSDLIRERREAVPSA